MGIVSSIVVFFISWWLILFFMLPIGVQRDDNVQEGNDTGAPVKAQLGRKMIWTTIGASLVLGTFWYLGEVVGFTFRPER